MATPLDAGDPGQKMLIAGGLDTAVVDLDLGAAWATAAKPAHDLSDAQKQSARNGRGNARH